MKYTKLEQNQESFSEMRSSIDLFRPQRAFSYLTLI